MENIIIALITSLIPSLVTIFNVIYTNSKTKQKTKTAQEEAEQAARDDQRKNIADGVQCILRRDIIREHSKWTKREHCPIYAKEALRQEYAAYHNLLGNDVATGLYEEVMALPTEEPTKGGTDNG